MNHNSPGEEQRPLDWIKKKSSHMPWDASKYEDEETCRVKVWGRFARQVLTQRKLACTK